MGCMTELRTVRSDFDRTTTLRPTAGERGSFSVDRDAGCSSLVGVHGGYMCALAVRSDIAATFTDTSAADLSWVLNAYNIVFAALLIPAGAACLIPASLALVIHAYTHGQLPRAVVN